MKKTLEQRIKELQKQRREFYKTTTKCDCDDCETIDFENQEIQNVLNSGGSNDDGDFEYCELVDMEIINKEQGNQKAVNLLKEWKERDGSEIEENYQQLKEVLDGE